MSKLDLSLFELEQVVVQLSYENNYSLWDKAGEIWTKLKKVYPELELSKEPQPVFTSFRVPNKYELEVKVDSLRYVHLKPQNTLKDFISNLLTFTDIAIEVLNIDKINRIGFRLFWQQEFKNSSESSKRVDFISENIEPDIKFFGISDGQLLYPSLLFKYENDKFGVRVNFKAEKRNFDVNFPFTAWPNLEKISKEIHSVLIDVDYSTKNIILLSQLDLEEWINSSFRVIKRDTQKIIDIYGR